MASQGNAIDYGDLLQTTRLQASASDSIRGVCFYGYSNPGYENTIEQFNIASGGQSVDTGGDKFDFRSTEFAESFPGMPDTPPTLKAVPQFEED